MKFFKNKSQKKVKLPDPRTIDEITQEYNQVAFKLGNAEYVARVHREEADRLFPKLIELNQEATRRKELDAKVAIKPVETKQEATNDTNG